MDIPYRDRIGRHMVIAITKEVREHSHLFKFRGQEELTIHRHLIEVKNPAHLHGEEPDGAA